MDPGEQEDSLYQSAIDAYERGDMKLVHHYAARLLAVAQTVGDHQGLARAHIFLGNAYLYYRGDADAADAAYSAALEHYRAIESPTGIISALIGKGAVNCDLLLDLTESRHYFEEALALARGGGHEFHLAFALANLGKTSRLEGDYGKALSYAGQSFEIFDRLDSPFAASQLISIAHYRALRREYTHAIRALREAYEKLRTQQRMLDVANYFETWFFIAFELSAFEDAARLLGFLEWYRDERTLPRLPHMLLWFAPRLEKLESRLGYERLAMLRREGELCSIAEANAVTDRIQPTDVVPG